MYLALVDDRGTIDSFFKHQLTGSLLSMKIKPEIDFQLSLFLTQSKSKYLSMMSLFWPLNRISYSLEPLRYCKIILAILVCWWPKFLANRAITKIAKVISSLISTIKNIIELIMPWYFFILVMIAWPSMWSYRINDFFIKMVAICILLR